MKKEPYILGILFVIGLLSLGWLYSDYVKNGEQTHRQSEVTHQLFLKTLSICYEKEGVSAKECQRQGQNKEQLSLQRQDLIAQYQMARATWIALAVGIIGFLLIFWTLLATKESNKAAWAAIKLMRAMSEKELRAYIMVEHIELLDRDGGGPPQFIVMLKNTGQTPATNINQFVAFGCVDMASQPISNFRDSKGNLPRLPQFIIGAGMTHPISVGLRRPIDEEVSDAMWAIELKVFGSGIITYDDVFGKRRRTIFKFHLGQTPNQGYVTIPDKKNNRIS